MRHSAGPRPQRDTIGRLLRGASYIAGMLGFAALTHSWGSPAAVNILIATAVLAATLGFVPPMVARLMRADLERIIDERLERVRVDLSADVTDALRHAVELGVQDGWLRRALQRVDIDPPRPRRLHAVRRDSEGA